MECIMFSWFKLANVEMSSIVDLYSMLHRSKGFLFLCILLSQEDLEAYGSYSTFAASSIGVSMNYTYYKDLLDAKW